MNKENKKTNNTKKEPIPESIENPYLNDSKNINNEDNIDLDIIIANPNTNNNLNPQLNNKVIKKKLFFFILGNNSR